MKKIIHILLSLLMIFSVFSVNVIADDQTANDDSGFYAVITKGDATYIINHEGYGVITGTPNTTSTLKFYYNGEELENDQVEVDNISRDENGNEVKDENGNDVLIFDFNVTTGEITFVNDGGGAFGYQYEEGKYAIVFVNCTDDNGDNNNDENNGDGCFFDYNGKRYQLGMGNIDTGEEGSSAVLHITDGSKNEVNSDGFNVNFILGIGEVVNGQIAGIGPEVLYNGISNVNVVATPAENIAVSVSDKKQTTDLDVDSYLINVSVPANTVYKGQLLVTLDLTIDENTQQYKFDYDIDIYKSTNAEATLEDSDNLFEILSSRSNFVNYCKTKLGLRESDINDRTFVKINLGSKNYHGLLNIDISKAENDIGGVELIGTGLTTITGCVNVKSGHPSFTGINFVADEDCKINGASVGIYASDPVTSHMFPFADVSSVHNCSFTGYDYGTWGDKQGLVSGVRDSVFTNCKIGICVDSVRHNYYSNYMKDTFVNCDKAVAILKYDQSTYQLAMMNMNFYNNKGGIDFYVEHPGDYYYTGNYYATNYTGSDTVDRVNSNVRSAKVVYAGAAVNNAELATNPCIRYPESEVEFGLDPLPGLYSKIPVGLQQKLNTADLLNMNTTVNLTLYDPNNNYAPSGSVQFGGND